MTVSSSSFSRTRSRELLFQLFLSSSYLRIIFDNSAHLRDSFSNLGLAVCFFRFMDKVDKKWVAKFSFNFRIWNRFLFGPKRLCEITDTVTVIKVNERIGVKLKLSSSKKYLFVVKLHDNFLSHLLSNAHCIVCHNFSRSWCS